jgi:hypothetical protein
MSLQEAVMSLADAAVSKVQYTGACIEGGGTRWLAVSTHTICMAHGRILHGRTRGARVPLPAQPRPSPAVSRAVSKVEEGDLDAAILILQEGIKEFGPRFPDSPEVGELHNQVALLLFMKGDVEAAAGHAQTALDFTRAAFGPTSVLTGHRQLRMGAVRVGQGQHGEATGLLQDACKALGDDPSKAEAELYLALVQLSRASDVTHVTALDGELFRCVRVMKDNFGVDSMVLRLALAQHDKLVTQALGAQALDASLCESLMAQHIKLLESVDPSGEELAIALYKIATFFYTQAGLIQLLQACLGTQMN